MMAFTLARQPSPECSGVVRGTPKGTNLIIYNADLSDSGDYICHAMNSAGEYMITITLDVQSPAAIVSISYKNGILICPFKLTCAVQGVPEPDIQ